MMTIMVMVMMILAIMMMAATDINLESGPLTL